ncbi:hematopoietic death receptor isoform X2 [Engraulis encrasicolus]|uniref:hematopoietic death receptor isoform X2 n=1 Tax=Engraulis encrasicolus TaxID=184585 RepID=UPI002FD142C2
MKRLSGQFQIVVLLWVIYFAAATLHLGELKENLRLNRTVRGISCKAGAYAHDGLCCLKCPPGTYVKEHCSGTLEEGTCEACDYDTYTEHENGLTQCLSCTKCPPDQVPTKTCSRTSDTECQCREGTFCLPDHACEVCKKCSKCKEDEFEKKRCTSTSNTICDKKAKVNTTDEQKTVLEGFFGVIIAVCVVLPLLVIAGIAIYVLRRKWPQKLRDAIGRKHASHGKSVPSETGEESFSAMREPEHRPLKQLVGSATSPEDEDTGLGDSLPNTASSSQASLSALPPTLPPAPLPCVVPPTQAQPQPPIACTNGNWSYNSGGACNSSSNSSSLSPNPLIQPLIRIVEHNGIPRLVPTNGDESLRKSFDLFDEVDVLFHKRFFRHIGLGDNDIRSTETVCPDDKMYTLLRMWRERQGMKASINDLIDALLHLDQRLSAENIIAKAVEFGLYKYEEAC